MRTAALALTAALAAHGFITPVPPARVTRTRRAAPRAASASPEPPPPPPPPPPPFFSGPPGSAPTAAELGSANLLNIVLSSTTDAEVNELVWRCLGYRRAAAADAAWDTALVFPKWLAAYPAPPDLIGVTRVYTKDVDGEAFRANQALVRSIPMAHKDGLRTHLRPLGFTGFKMAGLTPNMTRRAQCTNWLLFYREQLFGKTLDELKAERARNVEAENEQLRKAGKSLYVARGPDAPPAAEPPAT